VAAWNGLAIAALAEAGALLDEPEWIDAAVAAADLLVAVHLGAEGDDRLVRTSRDGVAGSSEGVLDDYGSVAEGFQVLAQVTGEEEWLILAGMLLDVAIQHFSDGAGGFFDTADDAPALIQRPRDPADNAEPSGWFAVANACVTQAALTGVADYRVIAEAALAVVSAVAPRSPRAVGWGLVAASALLAGPLEVAISTEPGDDRLPHWRRVALLGTSPGLVVVAGEADADGLPLLRDRPAIDGEPTAYVCRGFVCDAPVTALAAMARAVGARLDA
jgi:uncharacterized protein YyaL (SSP411 family)